MHISYCILKYLNATKTHTYVCNLGLGGFWVGIDNIYTLITANRIKYL